MTIKTISKIKDFGIFKNHNNSGVQDFGKYNLFYGWNGSGKSTLSSLFYCIENNALSEKFPSCEFLVNLEDDSTITQGNIGDSNLRIYTFNQDFIDNNISWNNLVKSILLVDKEKIADREKLERLKKQHQLDLENYIKESQEIQKLETSISTFGTDSARRLKASLQSIDTTDRYYMNYDRRKFEAFVISNLEATKSIAPLLSDEKVVELTNAAKPDQKSTISFTLQEINNDTFSKAKTRLDDLLKTSVASQAIQRLIDHSDIKAWVETGINLHNNHESNQCEFCGNTITQYRITQLESHFNDSYKAFQDRLIKANEWLSGQLISLPQLPSDTVFYEEFKLEYNKAITRINEAAAALNNEIAVWQIVLNKKTESPLETSFIAEPIKDRYINEFNDAINAIRIIIDKHNHKSENFQEETAKAKKSLELHYTATEVKLFGYHDKKNEVRDRTIKNAEFKGSIDNQLSEIRILEDSLSNESLGADQFNKSLHKFLGRSELKLRFNPIKKGYEIIRNDIELVNGKLSEGEKTAIAFVYFITKLNENDNKIEETIIVVDDPVSSFDSNHLFHAYSFLRCNCQSVNQLFVLTHNFTYFKLIRDWFNGNNQTRRKKNKSSNAFFFTIESSTGQPRQSTIKNADSSLIIYNSEYHYIFSRLYKYKDNKNLSRDDAFLTANLARKLLESFFSFKYPKHRSDIAQLMTFGLKGCTNTDEGTKEKIYRFINKYSHSVVIEVNEDSSENLVGESYNIIEDIFIWLKEVDEVHYKEMIEVVTTE
jgi:wobble nucleotide-excising tRNase